MTTTTTKIINGGTLTVTPKTEPYNEQENYGAFAVIKSDGSVFAWGNKDSGGDISSVASQLDGTIPVTQIFSNSQSFAALRSDGSVVTWGNKDSGGDSSLVSTQLNGDIDVTQIFSNGSAFAAIRADGSVVSWGRAGWDSITNQPKDIYPSSVAKQLNGSIPATKIFSLGNGFAAIRSDGSVVTWGGTEIDSSVANSLNGDIDVTDIYSNWSASAALRTDGSVISWGSAGYDPIEKKQLTIDTKEVLRKLDGTIPVTKIYMGANAFAAIRSDGSVVTWGNKDNGGDSSSVANQINGNIDVKEISAISGMMGGSGTFAALRVDGSVVTWGNITDRVHNSVDKWGNATDYKVVPMDSNAVYSQLAGKTVTKIYSNWIDSLVVLNK